MTNHVSIEKLEANIAQSVRDWTVPGAAVAMMKDGEIISCRGYGVKEAGGSDAVDGQTIFAIGSNTKPFTAAALGVLADDGRLGWDDPVTKHLPDFALWDPWITRSITLRDILAHRSGLGHLNRLLFSRLYDTAEVIRRLRYSKPAVEFRSEFNYSNFNYLLAGAIIEAVSGVSWQDIMYERILRPLGMSSTTTCYQDMLAFSNIASPHDVFKDDLIGSDARMVGMPKVIPWMDIGNAPSGSINSNAMDMLAWVGMLLAHGSTAGGQVIKPETVDELLAPHIVLRKPEQSNIAPLAALKPEVNFWCYGLGWFLVDYKGRKLCVHGGQVDGMSSLAGFVPQENLGFVILTNTNSTMMHMGLMFAICDAWMGGGQRDWSTELLGAAKFYAQQAEQQAEQILAMRREGGTALPLPCYASVYENDLYGKLSVSLEGTGLIVRYGSGFTGRLQHWREHDFIVRWEAGVVDAEMVHFIPGEGQRIGGLRFGEEAEVFRPRP